MRDLDPIMLEKRITELEKNSGQGGGTTDYHVYSTQERIVGVWVDGKHIYERTFTDININSTDDDHYISDVDNMLLFDYKVRFTGEGGNERINMHRSVVDSLHINNNKLYYYFSYNDSSLYETFKSCDITVQYTKTSDTPIN